MGASVWCGDGKQTDEIAHQLETGMVWINALKDPYPQCPWGGVKASGIGRELSKYGLLEFVNIRPVIKRK